MTSNQRSGGRERCDCDARMDELFPAYEALEASAGSGQD
jgi:hypothetical protein